MNLTSSLASPHFLVGLGSLGVFSAGTVGWNGRASSELYGESSPEELKKWNRRIPQPISGYSFYPPKFDGFKTDFDTDPLDSSKSAKELGLSGGDCFRNFFPGATYPTTTQMANPKSWQSQIQKPSMTVNANSSLVGCKLIKYNRFSSGGKNALVYRSETTISTSTEGVVLSAGFSNVKRTDKLQFKFWLLYMKKTGDSWTADWEHKLESKPEELTLSSNLKLLLPSGQTKEIGFDAAGVDASTLKNLDGPWTGSWLWHASDKGNSELFSSGNNTGVNIEKDWFISKNGDAQKPYENLKGKKGSWTDADTYCDGAMMWERGGALLRISNEVRDLCYSKSSST